MPKLNYNRYKFDVNERKNNYMNKNYVDILSNSIFSFSNSVNEIVEVDSNNENCNCISQNLFLTYIPKLGYVAPKSITSYEITDNVHLDGFPTTTTPTIDSSNNKIATTSFVQSLIQKNLNNINIIECSNNKISFIHIDFSNNSNNNITTCWKFINFKNIHNTCFN